MLFLYVNNKKLENENNLNITIALKKQQIVSVIRDILLLNKKLQNISWKN